MIKSFRHKGLEQFFVTGSKAGIQPAHAAKLTRQLQTLHTASHAEEMDVAGWKLHRLAGELNEHYSIWVNGNWRITFRFEDQDAILVDYQDYH
ncbi:MAG TPA: peptidase [bacterium]|nr:peptidase [bacterium]